MGATRTTAAPSAASHANARRLSVAALLALALVRGYQLALGPLARGACRFHPTCSAYALEAIARHGAWRGLGLTLKRLSRCHPLGSSGYDPVP